MQLIDLPNEILLHVTQYLNFKDKINFGRICNKSFLKFYNFDNLEYTLKEITDIFSIFKNDDTDEYVCEFMTENQFNYGCEIENYLIVYSYLEDIIENQDDDSDFDSIRDDLEILYYNDENIINDEMDNKIEKISDKIQRVYNNTYFDYELQQEMNSFFLSSICSIYTRKFIEHIENKNLPIKYDPSMNILDEHDVMKEVVKYYKYVLINNFDINKFCKKCASFGHIGYSKECIFYNTKYANIQMKIEEKELERKIQQKLKEQREAEERQKRRQIQEENRLKNLQKKKLNLSLKYIK
jgi:hypothetical protein